MEVAQAKVLVCPDGARRKGKTAPVKEQVDAVAGDMGESLATFVVVRNVGNDAPMTEGRDVWWHDVVEAADDECPPEPMDAEAPLYILYSSGSTAKPKGILHTTGGYLTQVSWTHEWVFDLKPDEGAPDYPDKDIWWALCEKYGVTIFYTAPTAIRACIKWGEEYPAKHDLSKLRLLGTVGEPINPKAWLWYHEVIGGGRCPIVDTWWQTETGAIMISPLPGLTEAKPGSCTTPLPGIEAKILDESSEEEKEPGSGQGLLVLTQPWPSMLRTLYSDDERFVETYFKKFGKETYLVGDAARQDDDGYFWVIGRIDDVINVSGHRLSTAEVESAIVSHPDVAEAAVIGQHDEDTGQSIVAFVTLRGDDDEGKEQAIRDHVADRIGKLARPKRIIWAADLPKTRSGKIMRRLLRDIAEGRELGDVTTLRDPAVMEQLKGKVAERAP